jgi:hypothetical protein
MRLKFKSLFAASVVCPGGSASGIGDVTGTNGLPSAAFWWNSNESKWGKVIHKSRSCKSLIMDMPNMNAPVKTMTKTIAPKEKRIASDIIILLSGQSI